MVIAALLLSTSTALQLERPAVPEYKLVIVPITPKEKVIFHSLRGLVPEVSPQERFGPEATPHGQKDPSGQVLIARSPKPESTKQFIRQPDRPPPLPADVPTPNLVALPPEPTQPVPKPAPKVFVPPPPSPTPVKKLETVQPVLEPPPSEKASKIQARNDLGKFLVPVPKEQPKPEPPPPAPPAPATDPANARQTPAPPSPGAPTATPGPQAVIVSLNPGTAPPPPGSRSAEFAKAPSAGVPSSGATQNGAVTVPGLMAHGLPGEAPKPPVVNDGPAPARRIVKEIVMPGVNRTMSAPLRPSSRILSRAIESQFAGRNVYTLVLPAPDLPGYSGDWVLWFAERQPEDDTRVRISAPIPTRKYAPITAATDAVPPVTVTVQFAVVLEKTGRIATAKTLRGATDPDTKLKALEELGTWDFKPALRNGDPIEVDLVIEIPMPLRVPAPTPR